MIRVRVFVVRVRTYFSNIPFKTYVTVLLEGIGLLANMIAILTFFGAINTPKDSPNFYINSQEFLVWSLIAGIYTLGLLGARFKRRWRKRIFESGYVEEEYTGLAANRSIFRSALHRDMFVRDFCFTLLVTFPLNLLYMRAMQTATSQSSQFSPWISLFAAIMFCIPVTLFIMLVSSIVDKALSLYVGD